LFLQEFFEFGFRKRLRSTQTLILFGLLSTAAASIGVLQFLNRSRYWWMVNSDLSFSEVNAQSFAFAGFGNHLALLGNSPLGRYHWFPFVWSGSIHRFIDAQPWWVTTRLAHLVWVGLLCMVVWSVVERNSKLRTSANTLISSAAGLIAGSVGNNYTAMFGVTFVLLITYTFLFRENDSRRIDIFLVYLILSIGLILTKPQMSVPLISGITLFKLARVVKRRSNQRSIFLSVISLVLPIPIALLSQKVLAGSHISSGKALTIQLVSVGSFGELGNARNLVAVTLALLVMIGYSLPLCVILIFLQRNRANSRVVIPLSLIASVSLLALVMTDAPFHTLGGYLLALVNCMTGLAIAWTLPDVVTSLKGNRKIIGGVLVALFASAVSAVYWPKLFNDEPTGSIVNISIRTLKGASWIPVLMVCLSTLFLFNFLFKVQDVGRKVLVGLFLLFPSVYLSVGFTDLYGSVIQNKTIDDSVETGIIAFDSDLVQIREIIRADNENPQIIGSNIFCPTEASDLCSNPGWWQKYVADFDEVYVPSRCIELPYNFVDWSLAAELGQFLIQGPQMFQGLYSWCQVPPEWINQRVEMSEIFGRNPDQQSFDFLCANDVDWFVADRLLTMEDSWNPYGRVRLVSGRLILIELDRTRCAGKGV